MAYTINTGCLTGYPSPSNIFYTLTHILRRLFSVAAIIAVRFQFCTIQSVSDGRSQGALMPANFIFISIEFLIAKCTSNITFKDRAVQWPFQVYVNSYLALLNARYYLQPNAHSIKSSKDNICHAVYHPGLHVDVSQNENFQMSLVNVSKHLNEPEAALRLARPDQTVMVGSCITVDWKRLMMRFSHSNQLGWWWRWTLSRQCNRLTCLVIISSLPHKVRLAKAIYVHSKLTPCWKCRKRENQSTNLWH